MVCNLSHAFCFFFFIHVFIYPCRERFIACRKLRAAFDAFLPPSPRTVSALLTGRRTMSGKSSISDFHMLSLITPKKMAVYSVFQSCGLLIVSIYHMPLFYLSPTLVLCVVHGMEKYPYPCKGHYSHFDTMICYFDTPFVHAPS